MSKNIIITGVSTGIGYTTTKLLINSGYKIFGSVRSEKDAESLKSEFGKQFYPLIFDVTDKENIYNCVELVKNEIGNKGICALINNAGLAVGGPLLEIPVENIRYQFEVNVFGLITVTQAFSKLLGAYKNAKHTGKIIMISSVAGKRSYPFVGPYSASKHALEGLSDALRRELMLYGIDVILVEPGPVKTEIWNKTPDPENNKFIGSDYEPPLRKFSGMLKSLKKMD